NLDLAASTVAVADAELQPVVGRGTVRAAPGQVVQVGLYWRPRDYVPSDLRVVVRLVDTAGATAMQVDTEPAEGTEHTTAWRPGFTYPDIRNIPLGGLASGEYRLFVRVYDPRT